MSYHPKKLLLSSFILIFILLSLMGTACSSNRPIPIESGTDLSMYITTDIHYIADSVHDNGSAFQKYWKTGDGRQLNYIDEIVSAFGSEVEKEKPDILIVSGDLTTNGEKESHLALAEKFKEIEEASGTSIYVIPGNHDISNPWARGFSEDKKFKVPSVDSSEFKDIYKDFGFGEAISRDNYSLSYLAAPSEDVWLLMLDTCEYYLNDKTNTPVTNGELGEDTLKWIEKCSKLAKEKNARIVTVMHHNLYNHSSRIHYGFTLDNHINVENTFRDNGLNLVFSGHLHIQDIKFNGEEENRIYDIASSSMVMYPFQYGVLDYSPERGFDYRTDRVDVEGWARENGKTDENLLNFSAYSEDFFTNASFTKAYNVVAETGLYTVIEAGYMAETMKLLNLNYFRGTTGLIKEQIENSRGYKLWIAADQVEALETMRAYILSMIPHNDIDNNKMHIK